MCCEKTLNGAWCQNEEQTLCNSGFKIAPTSCESTSFCKQGCCFDSVEGLCIENTPQRVCQESEGTWTDNPSCNIKQCTLGCCILGDQAALSTLTRCKSLSGYYGLETDFRSGITDENVCIATANAQDKGACVFGDDETGTPTCKFITRGECDAPAGQIIEGENITDISKKFYNDILCSAEELGTVCGPSTNTIIIEGKDEVRFIDSCGNLANIYDADRYNDKIYWKNVVPKSESCGAGSSNADSKSCGNCDYFLGSIGKKAGRLNSPTYGDYYCADLSCDGREHGESWCLSDPGAGNGQDRAGSKFYRAICLQNEKIIEPCADFRNEICIENGASFSESACIVNRWQSCTNQLDKDDCENLDARECKWIEGYYFSQEGQILQSKADNSTPNGLCVPMYSPGFQFWGDSDAQSSAVATTGAAILGSAIKSVQLVGNVITGRQTEDTEEKPFSATDTINTINQAGQLIEGTQKQETQQFQGQKASPFGTGVVQTTSTSSGSALCSKGNAKIIIKYKEEYDSAWNPLDWDKSEDCEKNCEYTTEEGREKWAEEMNQICVSLGDCGGHSNWIGKYTEDGFAAYYEQQRFAGSGGAEKLEKTDTTVTGGVIANLLKDVYGGNEE